MATLVISSTGTHGDHLPYIALGEALQQRGHTVRMAFRPSMHGYVRKAGLEAVACGAELSEDMARAQAADWDEWQPRQVSVAQQFAAFEQRMRREYPDIFSALETACADADLLICGLQRQLFGAMLANKTGLPWIAASVTPFFQCHETAQKIAQTQTFRQVFAPLMSDICAQLGVPTLDWLEYEKNPRALLGASQHFAPVLPSYAAYRHSGFWFYQDPAWSDWQPEPTLQGFVEDGDKPLYLTFSSIPVVNPAEVLAVHARAAAKLGRRLVVQRGCADFNRGQLADDCDPENVRFVDFLPQDWLLPRVAAIIHHGGVGTIARALRHDCPMLIEPLGNDQFFNAARILELKAGAAAHPHKITADSLARILEHKVLNAETRRGAQLLGAKIRAEKGTETACELIEAWLLSTKGTKYTKNNY